MGHEFFMLSREEQLNTIAKEANKALKNNGLGNYKIKYEQDMHYGEQFSIYNKNLPGNKFIGRTSTDEIYHIFDFINKDFKEYSAPQVLAAYNELMAFEYRCMGLNY